MWMPRVFNGTHELVGNTAELRHMGNLISCATQNVVSAADLS